MRLNEYINQNAISITKFAKLLNVSVATIYNILEGKRCVSLDVAIRIEDITKKQVTCRDLLPNKKKEPT